MQFTGSLRPILFSCLCLALLGTPNCGYGQALQNPAGVEVDASGVLRVRTFADPTGQLTRQRLEQTKAAMAPELARPSKLRKISLRRLEAAVAESIRTGAGLTDEMRYLAGLTRLQYVFAYPEAGDIVIAGPAEGFTLDLSGRPIGIHTGQSIVELQDLLVALRCYPPASTATSVIGCSIDPTPEGLVRMQQFLQSVQGRVQPHDAERIALGLRDSLGAQTVTIEGVSPASHFAQVLVEADYRMKLIGIGLENPPVRITSYVSRANPKDVSRNALQRWYFVPDYDAVRVSQDQLAMELVGRGVKLIGEHEMISTTGGRSQSGLIDRASQLFVTSFTQKYQELARQVPVYAQLRNLIDLAIAAAYLQDNDLYGMTGWSPSVFADETAVPVNTYTAPQQVESAVNVVWNGMTLRTPIGGGDTSQPQLALSSERVQVETAGTIGKAHQANDLQQVDPARWWWD